MTTVAELVDHYSKWTGARIGEVRIRARHLREAGLLPTGGRGRGAAHINSWHCANFLIGSLAAEMAINGPEAVRLFNKFLPHSLRGRLSDLGQEALLLFEEFSEQPHLAAEPNGSSLMLPQCPFVESIAKLIEWSRYEQGATVVERYIANIRCARHWPAAYIEINGRDRLIVEQEYRQPPPYPEKRPNSIEFAYWQVDTLHKVAKIGVEASIPGIILVCLGDLCGVFEDSAPPLNAIKINYGNAR